MKKFKKIATYFFITLLVLSAGSAVFIFTTDKGYELRLIAAEVILSSQHRSLAKLTFLSEDELNKILKNIQDPNYINSHNTHLSETIIDSINSGASFKDSTERLLDIYNDMVEERNIAEASGEEAQYLEKIREEKEKEEGKLIIRIDDIKQTFSDHFFQGKLLTISNPKNVRLATSKGQQVNTEFGEQIQVISKRENAIASTNASGFLDQNGNGNGGTPLGIVIEKGKIINKPKGKTHVAGLTKEGLLITGRYSANELLDLGVEYAAGFKPQLIANGKKMITDGNGGWGYGPRTAIGQKEDGSILLIVIDGRQAHSIGASMKDIQDILYEQGAVNAMAMDGGSSAIMYYNGSPVTTPSAVGNNPRYIPNAWVVSPLSKQEVEIYENNKLVKKYTNN